MNEGSGFVDFSIAGGKSNLSQNEEKKDGSWRYWRGAKAPSRPKINGDDFESASIHRCFGSSESTDDEEMAGWLGRGKLEKCTQYSSMIIHDNSTFWIVLLLSCRPSYVICLSSTTSTNVVLHSIGCFIISVNGTLILLNLRQISKINM